MENYTRIATELLRQATVKNLDEALPIYLAKFVCDLDRRASQKFKQWIFSDDEWNSELNKTSAG